MPQHWIERGPATGGAPPDFTNTPSANGVYVDGLTDELVIGTGTSGAASSTSLPQVRVLRTRVTIANVNTGATLLPAVAGRKYRLLDARVIAIGGAAATGTTIDILGTQSAASVKLVSFAQASLTQSTVLFPGVAGATVLADGASFQVCDVNTPITIGKTGSSFTGATNVDVVLVYTLES
jgi:hypothetical protein